MKKFWNVFCDMSAAVVFAGCGVLSILVGLGTIKSAIRNSETFSGLIDDEKEAK